MKNLTPIGTENQLEDVLCGESNDQKQDVQSKINFVANNIDKVKKVNGKKVYNPIVSGKNIEYNLQRCPRQFAHLLNSAERMYYYPIQYANIELEK